MKIHNRMMHDVVRVISQGSLCCRFKATIMNRSSSILLSTTSKTNATTHTRMLVATSIGENLSSPTF